MIRRSYATEGTETHDAQPRNEEYANGGLSCRGCSRPGLLHCTNLLRAVTASFASNGVGRPKRCCRTIRGALWCD